MSASKNLPSGPPFRIAPDAGPRRRRAAFSGSGGLDVPAMRSRIRPVRWAAGLLLAALCAMPCPAAAERDVQGAGTPVAEGTGTSPVSLASGIRGSVRGAPFDGLSLYAYPGEVERPVGPGFVAASAPDEEGRFQMDLPPGRYTVGARWRASGQPIGPLLPGDRVAETTALVEPDRYVDVGVLELRALDPEVRKTVSVEPPGGGVPVAGRVAHASGEPAEGLRVLAFTDPQMGARPAAHSAPTGADGAFRLSLPVGGRYFLVARGGAGGPVQPGELFGGYGGEDGAGVSAEAGTRIEGITIRVEPAR